MEMPRRLFETVDSCPAFTPSLDIIRVEGSNTFTFCLLDEKITWVTLHWNGIHEVRHVPEEGLCPWCEEGKQKLYKGFIGVKEPTGTTVKLLQVTQRSGAAFERAMHGKPMRGTWIMVQRSRGNKFSPLRIEIRPDWQKELLLPASPDMQQTFYNLWGPEAGRKHRRTPDGPEL